MTNKKIEMHGVTKAFETEEMRTLAISDLDLVIHEGDYVSIAGPSGCGKSTLLSLLGLLDRPTSGQYLIEGVNTSGLTLAQAAAIRSERIGFIFQSFNLIDELSVFENVALPLRYQRRNLDATQVKERVQGCLEKVQMTHRINHKPNQLSGGQQQRISIARALVSKPAILLVDEPTGNLDSKNGDAVMAMLAALNEEGTTICLVTHDPRYADFASIRLKMLDGKIVGGTRAETVVPLRAVAGTEAAM
jgi:putative ABC transport system ATP-binding protein